MFVHDLLRLCVANSFGNRFANSRVSYIVICLKPSAHNASICIDMDYKSLAGCWFGRVWLAVEETSNAMALDGIMFEGVSVRVRRPTDYNPSAAAILGPSEPNPNLNVQAIGLQPGGSGMVRLLFTAHLNSATLWTDCPSLVYLVVSRSTPHCTAKLRRGDSNTSSGMWLLIKIYMLRTQQTDPCMLKEKDFCLGTYVPYADNFDIVGHYSMALAQQKLGRHSEGALCLTLRWQPSDLWQLGCLELQVFRSLENESGHFENFYLVFEIV